MVEPKDSPGPSMDDDSPPCPWWTSSQGRPGDTPAWPIFRYSILNGFCGSLKQMWNKNMLWGHDFVKSVNCCWLPSPHEFPPEKFEPTTPIPGTRYLKTPGKCLKEFDTSFPSRTTDETQQSSNGHGLPTSPRRTNISPRISSQFSKL